MGRRARWPLYLQHYITGESRAGPHAGGLAGWRSRAERLGVATAAAPLSVSGAAPETSSYGPRATRRGRVPWLAAHCVLCAFVRRQARILQRLPSTGLPPAGLPPAGLRAPLWRAQWCAVRGAGSRHLPCCTAPARYATGYRLQATGYRLQATGRACTCTRHAESHAPPPPHAGRRRTWTLDGGRWLARQLRPAACSCMRSPRVPAARWGGDALHLRHRRSGSSRKADKMMARCRPCPSSTSAIAADILGRRWMWPRAAAIFAAAAHRPHANGGVADETE